MPYYMYVALQEDDKIAVFTIDPQTGKLTPQVEVPVAGGPFTMAISPDRKFLYAGTRESTQLYSFQINQANGGLTQNGTVSLEAWPVYISTDRKGKFVLSAYYQGAHAAVHPIGGDGPVGGPPIEWLATASGAHAMQTDPTNSYAFVPHIAGNGPNAIFQFRFDENTGRLTPNSPARVEPEAFLGPRHFLLSPFPGHPLLFQRAGLQRKRLSSGHCLGNAVVVSNHNHPARRLHREEHLLPNSDIGVGEVPVCSQPGP